MLAELGYSEYLGSDHSKTCPSVTFTAKYITISHGQLGNAMLRDKQWEKSTSFIMRLGCKQYLASHEPLPRTHRYQFQQYKQLM